MDDNEARPVVEFPFNGGYIAVKRPSDSQMMMLALSGSSTDMIKMIRRMLTMVEKLVGPETWDVIDNGMMSDEISVMDLMTLIGDVAKYPWADLEETKAPADQDQAAPASDPEPPAPQPRVVKRA